MILRKGDHSKEVLELQERLKEAGYLSSFEQAVFDDETHHAVKAFQDDHALVVDGIYGPKTHSALVGNDTSHLLKEADLIEAAKELDVDLACIKAVRAVESRSAGFLEKGKPVILFERHIMRRRLLANGFSKYQVSDLINQYPDVVNSRTGGYKGRSEEYPRLMKAADIDEVSAFESASWGLFQIMGYHWKYLGYASVTDFVNQMKESEGKQLNAFVRFIKADSNIHHALKFKDWEGFAKRYNGPAYAANRYDEKLQKAYKQAKADV